jgi:hypothetical protein
MIGWNKKLRTTFGETIKILSPGTGQQTFQILDSLIMIMVKMIMVTVNYILGRLTHPCYRKKYFVFWQAQRYIQKYSRSYHYTFTDYETLIKGFAVPSVFTAIYSNIIFMLLGQWNHRTIWLQPWCFRFVSVNWSVGINMYPTILLRAGRPWFDSREEQYLSLLQCPVRPWGPPSSYPMYTRVCYPEGKEDWAWS